MNLFNDYMKATFLDDEWLARTARNCERLKNAAGQEIATSGAAHEARAGEVNRQDEAVLPVPTAPSDEHLNNGRCGVEADTRVTGSPLGSQIDRPDRQSGQVSGRRDWNGSSAPSSSTFSDEQLIENYFYDNQSACRECKYYIGPEFEPHGEEVVFCHLLKLSEKGMKVSKDECPGCQESQQENI